MILLRLYLLVGLVVHKLVWELLKRRSVHQSEKALSPRPIQVKAIKWLKAAILLGLLVQTFTADVLPIDSQPLALRVTGATIFTIGLAVAILGRIQLGDNWSDIEAAKVLTNQHVVSKGIYRLIRHPIYVGDLLLLLGLQLSLNSWLVMFVILLAPLVLWRAVREEVMLVDKLPGYADYCNDTKRFIPFVV